MRFDKILGAVAISALASAAQPAWAQDAAKQVSAERAGEPGDDIIVTGTRVVGRSKLDTSAPVDVLTNTDLQHQGSTELAQALSNIAPSLDFPRASGNNLTDSVRPATLRGLSPDQALVLINGTRAHTSALLNINNSVGRGSAAVDLNTIPTVALDRVEVLRDGASAQYGSDAIAGVINLRLREAREGGAASVTYGIYNTDVVLPRSERHVTGEPSLTVSGWQGFGYGNDGYLTVSGEYLRRKPTNRSDLDPRLATPRVDARYGDSDLKQYSLWANTGVSINDNWKLYGWAGYQYRDSTSAAFYIVPSASSALAGFPDGFLPYINVRSRDLNSAIGLTGELGDWKVDINVSYGRNKLKLKTLNSANYSLGAATPHDFNSGALTYDQLVGGLDVTRTFDIFQSLNLAFGIEGRREGFKIAAGELSSYTGTGAQGFPGYSVLNAINKHRGNGSIYLDLEAQVTPKLLVGLAGRGEDYSDFGKTGTGKISARYDFTPSFALRATASTGFRAPSLQQSYFTSIASVIDSRAIPMLTGTFPSISPVAQALGGKPLEPEKSTNVSAGLVFRHGPFDLTVDAYRIHIHNQLALSEIISATGSSSAAVNQAVAAILAPFNVPQARFFINGVASTARGIDVVGHYRLAAGKTGIFDLTVAANVNDIKVTHVPTSTSTLNPAPPLFARQRVLTFEEGTPGQKVAGTLNWSLDKIGATLRGTYYANVVTPGVTAATDIPTGNKFITDLEFRYQESKGLQLALGVNNLFDIYPKPLPTNLNTIGAVGFPSYAPFGFNGRFLYVRAGLSW